MADPRAKAIDLATKLLRTAAPTSGATIAERTTAALHAAELISQHELAVSIPEPVKRRRGPRVQHSPAQAAYRYSPHDWTAYRLEVAVGCANCGRTMLEGELVFVQPASGHFIHQDLGCEEQGDDQ